MNINKFTQKSLQAVQNCERIAMDYGNQEIAQEHLLYALLTQDDSLIAKLMEKMGLDKNLIINRVEEAIQKRPKVQGGQQYVGQDLNNALEPGHAVGAPLPFTAQVMEILQHLHTEGLGQADHSAIVNYYEELTGTKIRR